MVDPNGIDARNGNETWSFPELGIGPDGEMGLHLSRQKNEGVIRDSFDSTFLSHSSPQTGVWSISATFGGIGGSFGTYGKSPGDFYSRDPDMYQHLDGAVVNFGISILAEPNEYDFENIYKLADFIRYPSGATTYLHYKTAQVSGPYGTLTVSRVQSATTNTGYQIKFSYASSDPYNAAWGTRVSATAVNMAVEYCDPSADSCSLQSWPTTTYSQVPYGSGGVTRSASRPDGTVANMTWVNANGIGDFILSDTADPSSGRRYAYTSIWQCENPNQDPSSFCSMGSNSRVSLFTDGGRSTSYTYSLVSGDIRQISAATSGIGTTIYNSDGAGALGVRAARNELSHTSSFNYDNNGKLVRAQWPEGNYTEYVRDAYGRVTQEIVHSKGNASTISTSRTFGACAWGVLTCNKPTSETDANGRTTDYRYNARGQMTAEIQPPDTNGVRPLRRWEYEDRYAYVKAANGSFVPASSPVSVPVREIICRSTFNGNMLAPACGSTSDEVVTVYGYGGQGSKNPLLVKSLQVTADGKSLLTCYSYDSFGNRVSETSPRAGLATCP
ncbi:RHS repeat domain-containing protein [Sphingobium sp. YR768]|uniref:RHS repeat domain-containing protein n=1 Tax=Sphingobium sp. YR768 TaxID=1884365 RepID=UPI0015A67745|nr:RHS repeat domain-containing protein [Sphingobium sp. YR768]